MAERRTPRRRRRLLIAGGATAVVIAAAAGLVLSSPKSGAASTALTATVRRADVVVTVTGSGSIVDQYTYSVPASGAPALTELAGVATGSSGGSSASATTAGASAAGSTGTSGEDTTKSVSVSIGQAVRKDQKLAVATDSNDKDHTVKSPVAGHVRTIATAAGASASTVATIGAGRTLVAVDVNENRISEVRRGQTVSIAFGTAGATVDGSVEQIAQVADGSSGVQEYQVLVDPDSLPSGARLGMTATATIDISRHDDVLTVPASAITEKHGEDTVLVVDGGQSLRTVTVEVGLVGDAAVEITSGLSAGQKVVVGTTGSVPASTGVRAPGA